MFLFCSYLKMSQSTPNKSSTVIAEESGNGIFVSDYSCRTGIQPWGHCRSKKRIDRTIFWTDPAIPVIAAAGCVFSLPSMNPLECAANPSHDTLTYCLKPSGSSHAQYFRTRRNRCRCPRRGETARRLELALSQAGAAVFVTSAVKPSTSCGR